MKDVVIDIDGTRHRLYNKDVVVCGCSLCSLSEQCLYDERSFCFPFLKGYEYGHFELDKKKK